MRAFAEHPSVPREWEIRSPLADFVIGFSEMIPRNKKSAARRSMMQPVRSAV